MIGPTPPSAEAKNHMSTGLPRGKTIIDVFSDLMGYLFKSTKSLFISSDINAESRWNSASLELVLTHPNGWGGLQQGQLRAAAVQAGVIPGTKEGLSRVHFVTEGEASFNFCVTHTQAGETLKVWHQSNHHALVYYLTYQQFGDSVLIVDAGGGTIDISSYTVLKNAPLQVEELFQPKCQPPRLQSSLWSLKRSYKVCCREVNSSRPGRGRWSKVGPGIAPPLRFPLNSN